jgi:hypothetical protein
MVAMRGSIIPEPLAMPPTRKRPTSVVTSTAASFGNGSVVMMARAAAPPPSSDNAVTAAGTPVRRAPMARFTPITPVDATITCCGSTARAAATSADISSASAMPCGPVQALAQPLFVTIAQATPPLVARCC